jgi:hypothetical protein
MASPALAALALALVLALAPVTLAGQKHLLGGPCDYDAYPGKALITLSQTRPLEPHEPSPGYQPYKVMFTFSPDAPMPPGLANPGREYRFTLTDGSDPGPKFIAKYKLKAGMTRPCVLQIIKKGTCSPIVFAFPGLDSNDHSLPR